MKKKLWQKIKSAQKNIFVFFWELAARTLDREARGEALDDTSILFMVKYWS